jgi:integrase
MFAWGIEHGPVSSNPFSDLKLATAPRRERFLTKAEAVCLLNATAQLEAESTISNTFADAVRLLLLTGARKTEILGLRWCEVDTMRKALVLPPERTKAGGKTGERRIALSLAAIEILTRRRRAVTRIECDANASAKAQAPSDFVFPAIRGQGHATGLRRAFLRICVRAKLSGFRIHDLRHSFASFAIADGASLFLVGKLLGHASARTTERYAHLSSDPLSEAVDRIGSQIVPMSRAAGDVVPFIRSV